MKIVVICTAGVFLIIRCSPLFQEANYILPLMTILGSLTTFFAATTALVQTDLKRVIAYSTCSQLGYHKKSGATVYKGSFKKRYFSSKPNLTDILPIIYVKKYLNLTVSGRYIIKSNFKGKAVIYLWKNKINGRSYVGRTINLWNRLTKYSSNAYLVQHANKMPICGALLKMGHTSFEFYVLEEISKDNIQNLAIRENFWFNQLKPSYNLAAILDTFVGANHPRFGKVVSQEIRDKISATLTGRKPTKEEIQNHIIGAPKKAVYCFDSTTKKLLVVFEGQRIMARELGVILVLIQRKIDSHKTFTCFYNGTKQTWFLRSKPTPL
jgi:hypothetical protein